MVRPDRPPGCIKAGRRTGPTRRSLMGAALLGAGAGSGLLPAAAQAPLDAQFAPPPTADARKLTLRFATNYVGVHPMATAVRGLLKAFPSEHPNLSIHI